MANKHAWLSGTVSHPKLPTKHATTQTENVHPTPVSSRIMNATTVTTQKQWEGKAKGRDISTKEGDRIGNELKHWGKAKVRKCAAKERAWDQYWEWCVQLVVVYRRQQRLNEITSSPPLSPHWEDRQAHEVRVIMASSKRIQNTGNGKWSALAGSKARRSAAALDHHRFSASEYACRHGERQAARE